MIQIIIIQTKEIELGKKKLKRVLQHIHILLSSIWSASTVNSQSLKVLINICHVQGFPFPVSHSSRILVTIFSGSPRHACLKLFTLLPVLSWRRNIPNVLYSVLTCWGTLSWRSSGRVGSWSKMKYTGTNINTAGFKWKLQIANKVIACMTHVNNKLTSVSTGKRSLSSIHLHRTCSRVNWKINYNAIQWIIQWRISCSNIPVSEACLLLKGFSFPKIPAVTNEECNVKTLIEAGHQKNTE